jgi:hypothetical protein
MFFYFVGFISIFPRHLIRGGRDLLSKQDKSIAVWATFYPDNRKEQMAVVRSSLQTVAYTSADVAAKWKSERNSEKTKNELFEL